MRKKKGEEKKLPTQLPMRRMKRKISAVSKESSQPLFELDPLQFFWDVSLKKVHRPLPAVTTLLAVAPQHRSQQPIGDGKGTSVQLPRSSYNDIHVPLLQTSTESNGIPGLKTNSTAKDTIFNETTEVGTGREDGSSMMGSFMKQTSIVLTRGHHKRIKELSLLMDNRVSLNINQKKELKKLKELIDVERRHYSDAMNDFYHRNYERFLTGFKVQGPSSQFVSIYSEYVKKYQEIFMNTRQPTPVMTYSKCMQFLSIPTNIGSQKVPRIDMGTLQPRNLYSSDVCARAQSDWIQSLLQISTLTRRGTPQILSHPICDDEKAKALAAEYGVDIITTDKALKALLLYPSDGSSQESQFVIPLSSICVSTKPPLSIMAMDDPVPQPLTARQCLSEGIQQTIYDTLQSSAASDTEDSSELQLVYTLLSLPKVVGMQDCKVLVRSSNQLLDDKGAPLKLFAQLEYFTECGLEQYDTCDRCIWLMEKILQRRCCVFTIRVDPESSHIMKVEEKDIADTLTDGIGRSLIDEASVDFDIDHRFNVMMHILRGVKTIYSGPDSRRFMMCLPGRTMDAPPESTVSIHPASNQKSEPTSVVIDLHAEFYEGDKVFMSKAALLKCFKLWEWKDGQIPFCFPIQEHEEKDPNERPSY